MRRKAEAVRLLALALGAAALAALPEAVLRARRGPPPSEELWLEQARYEREETSKPFFTLKMENGEPTFVPNRARSVAVPFPRDKKPGEKRVFVVGESVAERLPVDMLAARLGPGVRVINCGMGAYDSALAADVAEEVLQDGADLLIVLVGNNSRSGPERGGWAAYRANLALRRLWTWRLAQDWAARRFLRPSGARERAARFEKGLRRILRAARTAGVPAVAATLAVNQRGLPPPGELPLDRPRFLAADLALARGRARDAADLLSAELAERSDDAMTHYLRAKALDASGDAGSAAAEYGAAAELDDAVHCPPSRDARIRRVAAEEGASVADLEALFAARAAGGAPGWESFVDGVHWRHGLDAAVVEALEGDPVGAAARAKAVSARWSADEARELELRAIADALQIGEEYDPPILVERVVAEFARAGEVDRAGLRALLDDPARVERTLDENEWTRFLHGKVGESWGVVLAHAGEAAARNGDAARAAELLTRGEGLGRGASLARFVRGRAAWAAGRIAEAESVWNALPADSRERTEAGFYRAAR
jgi:hypothetical protein